MVSGAVSTTKVKAGKAAEFERLVRALQAKVKAREPGNLIWELWRLNGAPDTYKMVELYRDQAAYDEHSASVHVTQSNEAIMACIEELETQFVSGLE
jgi:quinol monooxygenase YgiN